MEIIRTFEHSEKHTSVALGFFDGVHLGHKAVIDDAVKYAKEHNLVPTVFTLLQSPRSVITGENIGKVITEEEKIAVLESLGIKRVYIIDFRDIMNISAEEFIDKTVVDCFNAKHVVCGFNYRFGSGGKGNGEILHKLCQKRNIAVTTKNHIDFQGEPVSSTRIRQCIAKGDIKSVNNMLGREYGFNLPVIHGRQLGRKLGTPTLNQRFPSKLVCLSFGVYVTKVTVFGKEYCGVTNVGIKPTVGSDEILIETWLPDYNGKEFYGETVNIRFIDYIRAEKKFDSIDDLKKEIIKNGIQAKEIYKYAEKQ